MESYMYIVGAERPVLTIRSFLFTLTSVRILCLSIFGIFVCLCPYSQYHRMETISLTISKSQDTFTDCNDVNEVNTDGHKNNKKDIEIGFEELKYGTASPEFQK